MTNQPNP